MAIHKQCGFAPANIKINNNFSWINSYLLDALFWSRRSHDPQTQCGCILVAEDNTPISHGYNGIIRNVDTDKLPLTRPEKYCYMQHSEANAIYNAVRQGKSTMNASAYVTGKPCIACLQAMYQCGISNIYYTDFNTPKMVEAEQEKFSYLISLMHPKLEVFYIPKTILNSDPFKECLAIMEKDK